MIIIIGAGLSGLLTAYLLKKEGIPFKILEARNRVGGRINTLHGKDNTPIEMGATWFNDQHRHLKTLLDDLKIEYFEQLIDSTVFYQPSSHTPTQVVPMPKQASSYRISGGTSKLIETLYQKLDTKDVLLNQSVIEINNVNNIIHVHADDIHECSMVVLAMPPKLWAKNILFKPSLPNRLISVATQTQTWMEDSIKIALTYSHPFWKQENIPATLFSNVGPITELYDHCNHQGSKYALCGFINSSFKHLSFAERQEIVINQMKSIFGISAEKFTHYEECIWSNEKHTFQTSEDLLYPHQNNGNPIFNESFYNGQLLISSAESASENPGYMDGAVFSAYVTFQKIMNMQHNI